MWLCDGQETVFRIHTDVFLHCSSLSGAKSRSVSNEVLKQKVTML